MSGRTYPVEVRYRPLADPDDPDREPRDQVQGILDAVAELKRDGPGDILVFLSGEREIRDTADALAGQDDLDVLPLYARLSSAEQHRVFEPGRFAHSRLGRRVVLATNVAETSLTVPGIHYVIDPGTARISRYSHRTKVQRLPIERISQASASQRAGRCGRTADGVCIRLYTEEDFAARPAFTDPEILRTNLASVILQMAALDLGDMADFPFIDPPDSRNIADGTRLLEELGAFAPGKGQRPVTAASDRRGQKAGPAAGGPAAGPDDPGGRPARLRPRSADHRGRAVHHRPAGAADRAPRGSRRDAPAVRRARVRLPRLFSRCGTTCARSRPSCRHPRSEECAGGSISHYLRVREWQDVYGQLRQAAADLGVVIGRDRRRPRPAEPAEPAEPADRFPAELADRVHMSLLAGLLSHIGMQDTRTQNTGAVQRGKRRGPAEFSGARGARFAIFPDSVLARKPPSWVVAAELVETSRLWARVTARIDPAWAEPLAEHLVRRSYSEPRWDARRGAVLATEKVSLYGLPIVPARTVNFARIDPAAARELFIQHALVDGEWQTHHRFFARNQRVLDEAASLEQKARRRGIVADDTVLFDFYDRRIPASVTSARHFDSWWKKTRAADPALLDLSLADLVGPAAEEIGPADYPASWGELPLSYEFAPGAPDDGVTVDIPLAQLNQVDAAEFGWQVPGLREETVTELIRTLPKQLRTLFVPVPDTARKVLPELGAPDGDLPGALSAALGRLGGVPVPRSAFDESRLPAHLRITFRVLDDGPGADSTVLASGKDLAELRRQLRPRLQATLSEAARGLTRTGLRDWDFESLPRVFEHGQVRAYPALADAGDAVDIRLFETEAEADAAMLQGTRRLLLLAVPSGARAVAGRLPVSAKLAMSRHPYRSTDALLDDCAAAAADQIIRDAGGPAWDAAGFARLLDFARERLAAETADVVARVAQVLAEAHAAEASLAGQPNPALAAAFDDMRSQLRR